MKEKILLDTDIGSDIDDSVCLAYLLKQRECDLLGITTVSGEPVNRAKLASVICMAAGRGDIPIYPGVERPILTPQKQPTAHQSEMLPKWPHETSFPEGEAVEFMRRTIRANPGEVTLLGIGPMTNIGLLFAVDPEIPKLLKRLVIMCGVFTYRYMGDICLTEWNARCDPYATAIVYNAPVETVMSIGLDVTGQVAMEKDEIIRTYTSDLMKVILDFSGVLDGTRKRIIYHDPLAAATIFQKDICVFKRGNVTVEMGAGQLEGLTRWTPDPEGNDEIALAVDRERFFKHYFDIVNQA